MSQYAAARRSPPPVPLTTIENILEGIRGQFDIWFLKHEHEALAKLEIHAELDSYLANIQQYVVQGGEVEWAKWRRVVSFRNRDGVAFNGNFQHKLEQELNLLLGYITSLEAHLPEAVTANRLSLVHRP
ncbi:hypothetical protein JCM6882_008266 [Rhodosporidiobolus microsporus]